MCTSFLECFGPLDGATALSASLQYTPELDYIDLSHNNIGSDGATALSASLQYTPALEDLDLSSNNIGSDGATALLASLQYTPKLRSLNLSDHNIGSDGATARSASLQYITHQHLATLIYFVNHSGVLLALSKGPEHPRKTCLTDPLHNSITN